MKWPSPLGKKERRTEDGSGRTGKYPLSECEEDDSCTIMATQDKQSMEMGLFSGARVRIIKNRIESPNMVVAVGDSRYMISKDTARQITVK